MRNLLGGNAHSARYGETIHDGTVKPEALNHQGRVKIPKISSWAVTQQNLWEKDRPKCETDRKRMSNVAESGEEHSIICRMFMAATSRMCEDLTLRQMFDVIVGE